MTESLKIGAVLRANGERAAAQGCANDFPEGCYGNYRGLKELVTTSGFSVLTTSAVLIVPSATPRVTINTALVVKTSKSPLVGD